MRWVRADLKFRAKGVLRKTYWVAFAISFILMLVGGSGSTGGGSSGSNNKNHSEINSAKRYINSDFGVINYNVGSNNFSFDGGNFLPGFLKPILGISGSLLAASLIFISILSIIFVLLFRVIIGYSVEVGARRYFIDTAQYFTSGFERLLYVFKNKCWANVTFAMFLRSLYTFLWTLALVIPGIIKSYAYIMTPYILADNPNIDPNRALSLSEEMTMGHKLDIFVLELSFIGWWILGGLLFGIGIWFVRPYENATKAQLYITLRQNAIDNRITTYEELNMSVSF